MKYFAGMLAGVLLVAAATAGIYHLWDDATHTRRNDNGGVLNATPASTIPPDKPAPAEGSVVVVGSITSAHLEGVTLPALPMPVTVTTPERGFGAGATISGIQVKGKPSAIEWDAGTPLSISGGGGALLLAPVTVDVSGDGATVLLDTADGRPHGFAAATYRIDGPVAVGTGSLASPQDSATFDATADSHVVFRGSASAPLPIELLGNTSGQGKLVLTGDLTIAHHDRSKTAASTVTLDSGTYQVAITADAGGMRVFAVITGTVH